MTWYVLLQTIQYVTRSKVMDTETRELSSVSRGKIRPQETDDWKNEKLFVPPLPPTNLRGCHLIRIQYDVFVSSSVLLDMRGYIPGKPISLLAKITFNSLAFMKNSRMFRPRNCENIFERGKKIL